MVREMKYIKSKDNEKFKFAKSLLKSKYRNREKKYLAEGLRTVLLAITYEADIEWVFLSEEFAKNDSNKCYIEELSKCKNLFVLSDDLISKLSQTETSQGVIAVLNMKNKDLSVLEGEKVKKVVVLDRVADPGNMGTIIRTADASGYDAIILTKGCVDIYNPKVVRSSMGSIFYMDIVVSDDGEILNTLKDNDFCIVSSYLDTDNEFNSVKYPEKTALILGNEANGISDFWIDNSDILVKIPMFGKAESFNVAISSGILMYHISTFDRK